MYTKIVEISTLAGTPYTYVLIHIWLHRASYQAKEEPIGDNAFVMDLLRTDLRYVKDSQGRLKTLDGDFIHPDRATGSEEYEREEFNIDVPQEILTNIRSYLARRKKLEGTENAYPTFHARPALTRSEDNPRGILSMSDVVDLVGMEVTK